MLKNSIFNQDINVFLKNIKIKADLIIADPPYNLKVDHWDVFQNEKEYFLFMKKWIILLSKRVKEGGSVYLFNTARNSALILPLLEKKGFILNNWIIWYKKDGMSFNKKKYVNNQETILFLSYKKIPNTFNYDSIRVPYKSVARINHAKKNGILKNNKRWYPNSKGSMATDIWEFSSYRHNNKLNGKTKKSFHRTPKPHKMIERMILASSNENDLILDLFSGTAAVSKLSINLKRNSLGCEIDKDCLKRIKDINLEIIY